MEPLQNAFEPYRHLDPLGWVGVFRFLPLWGGLVAIAVGVVMMLFGGRQLFRLVAGPLGALIAAVWAVPLAQRLGFGGSLRQISLVATFGLFGAGLLWPPFVVFFAFGVPAGLPAGVVAGSAMRALTSFMRHLWSRWRERERPRWAPAAIVARRADRADGSAPRCGRGPP